MICDLAETYHILNYRELLPSLVATLVLGLGPNSRVKMKLSGRTITTDQMLLLLVVDDLNLLVWTKTKDAEHNRNRPKSVFKKLIGIGNPKKDDLMSFETPEEFEEYMKRFSEATPCQKQ